MAAPGFGAGFSAALSCSNFFFVSGGMISDATMRLPARHLDDIAQNFRPGFAPGCAVRIVCVGLRAGELNHVGIERVLLPDLQVTLAVALHDLRLGARRTVFTGLDEHGPLDRDVLTGPELKLDTSTV